MSTLKEAQQLLDKLKVQGVQGVACLCHIDLLDIVH